MKTLTTIHCSQLKVDGFHKKLQKKQIPLKILELMTPPYLLFLNPF